MRKLDKIDLKIIQILQKNARTPLKEIAAQVVPVIAVGIGEDRKAGAGRSDNRVHGKSESAVPQLSY